VSSFDLTNTQPERACLPAPDAVIAQPTGYGVRIGRSIQGIVVVIAIGASYGD